MNVIRIVEESYDKIGETYDSYRDHDKFIPELEKFASMLPKGGKILDVGSGSGIPTSKFLADSGFDVVGADISESMVKLAQKYVPNATFVKKNMLTLDFDDESFDGIICVYSLWHVPRSNHHFIYLNFRRMLTDNGILVINTGVRESEGMSDFFGEPMFWSNNNTEKTLELVKKAGFTINFEGVLKRGGEYQYWIFAKKK